MSANKRTGLMNILTAIGRKVGWLVYPTYSITDISTRRRIVLSAMLSLAVFLVVLTGFVANIFVYGVDHFVTFFLAALSIILFLAYVFSRSRAFRYVGSALLTFSLSASAFVVAVSHPDRETLYISGVILTFVPLALVMGSALLPSLGSFALTATNLTGVLLLPVLLPTYPLDRAGLDAGVILGIGVLLLGVNAYRNGTEQLRLAEIQRITQQSVFPTQMEQSYHLDSVTRDITRRKQAEQEREILQHLALELTAPLEKIELVKILAKCCQQLFLYDSFRFDLYDEQEQLRIPVYAEDTPAEGQTPVDVETDSEARKPGIIRGVFDNKPVLVNRKPGKITDGLIPWGFASRRSQSMLFVPVRWHGHCVGVVYVQSYTPERYNDRDLMLLQMVADQCGAALARVQADVERENLIRELTAKNAELERFTYTVSHDLKTPLITITGFLGYLEEDATAGDIERVRHDSLRINEAVSRMKLLLDELLELSRIGRLINPPETIAFEELVNEALAAARGRLEARGITVNIQADLPSIHGDRQRLVEVLQNLVDNAAKFMGDQPVPRIEIGCQEQDGSPVFFVKDNGIGVEPRFHEQIFGLFNKLDPAIEGTGVGLALVRRIIEVHGGSIWVESEIGKGASFCFTIPAPGSQYKR